jgi:hypothetical protein
MPMATSKSAKKNPAQNQQPDCVAVINCMNTID